MARPSRPGDASSARTKVAFGSIIKYLPPAEPAAHWMSVGVGTLRTMANFAVRLVHGPGWDASRPIRSQDAWDEHAAFMDGLVDEGFIILGGPVGDGEQTLHVVEAADDNQIRARLAHDPWARAGLLQIGTIEPWALWLNSRRPASSGQ
jgi:uncharacterized protein YciI